MGVRPLSPTTVLLPVGGRWVIDIYTTDDDGCPVAAEPSVVVTLPGGTTTSPTFEMGYMGRYRAAHVVSTAGRYVARVTAGDLGAVDFAAQVEAVTAQTGMPTVEDYRLYHQDAGGSLTDDAIQEALDAEAAAQRAVCRVEAVYPNDLREALMRRVARNLAMRGLPLAIPRGDADAGPQILPGRDPEVRRLEAPHRKLVVG